TTAHATLLGAKRARGVLRGGRAERVLLAQQTAGRRGETTGAAAAQYLLLLGLGVGPAARQVLKLAQGGVLEGRTLQPLPPRAVPEQRPVQREDLLQREADL